MLGWFKKKFGKKQAEEEAVEQKPGEVAGAEPEEAVGQEDTGAESVPESAEALDDKGDDLIKTSPGEGEEFFSISPKQDISFDIAGELAEFFPELSSRAGQEGEPPKSPVDREPVPGKPEASLAEEPETGAESQPVDDVVEVEAAVSVVLAEQSVAPVPPEAAETIEERESVGETGAAPGVTEIAGESVVEALTEFFPTEEAQPEQKAVEEAATPVDAFEVELEAVPVSMAEEAVVTEPEPEPGPEAAFEPAEPVEAETVEAVVAETAEDEAIEPPLEAITELPVPPEKQSREELAPEEPVVAITEREAAVESEGGASVEEALETEAPSIEARLPGEEKGVEAGDEEQGGERAVHPAAPLAERTQEKPASKSLFKRLRDRLGKTRDAFIYRLDRLFLGKKEIDQDLFEQLEEILITADLGVKTTLELIDRARKKVKRDQLSDPQALKTIIRDEILSYIEASDQPAELVMPEEGPFVIMVVGVNGVGKTTTIGKIAAKFVRSGQSVLLVAGDPFRAAAINQLRIWGERVGGRGHCPETRGRSFLSGL
jgi:fused signal recognition particle receptor